MQCAASSEPFLSLIVIVSSAQSFDSRTRARGKPPGSVAGETTRGS